MTTVSPSRTCAATAWRIGTTLETSDIGHQTSVRHLAQAFVDDAQRRFDIVVVHHERRREPERAFASAQEQESLLEGALHQLVRHIGGGLARGAILHELDT